jgi:hypothetical protein
MGQFYCMSDVSAVHEKLAGKIVWYSYECTLYIIEIIEEIIWWDWKVHGFQN